MINQVLPAEIFTSVISNLSLEDKLNCMHVCKFWYNTVTSTTLFENLEFKKNPKKFNQALALFEEKPYLGKQVRYLAVEELQDIDMETVISLATLFPNVTTLDWIERKYRQTEHYNQFKFMPESYKEALRIWKNLERIVDYPTYIFLHISTSLLYTCTMSKLKYLEVVLDDYISMRVGRELHGRNMLAALIKYIHNAPNLEHLVVSKTAIKLLDLKALQTSLPKLKKIDLNIVVLYMNDNLVEEDNYQPTKSSCLESLSITAFPQDQFAGVRSSDYTQTLINWLNFIGTNYTNLKIFDFAYGEFSKEGEAFTDALAGALVNMKKLTSYGVVATPLSRPILDALESSNVQLDRLKLDMVNQDLMEQQLQLVTSSLATQAVKTWDIYCKITVTDMHITSFSQNFIPFSKTLTHLTHLKLWYKDYISDGVSVALLVDILQHLPQLESLDFYVLCFLNAEAAQQLHNTMITQRLQINSNIKRLTLYVDATGHADWCLMDHLNTTFRFMLQSCPKMEHFKLNGIIFDPHSKDPLDLDFLGCKNYHLKSIQIDLYNNGYYTFDKTIGREGKRWINYYRSIKDEDFKAEKRSYHVNLTWSGGGNVKLQLADCLMCVEKRR